jgi:Flp pilus assembly protein TadG
MTGNLIQAPASAKKTSFRGIRRFVFLGRRGTAMVEFALVFPVAMLLVFSVIDMSLYYYYESSMSHTLRSTLRYAITGKVMTDGSGNKMSRKDSAIQFARQIAPPLITITAAGNTTTDTLMFCKADVSGYSLLGSDLGGSGAKIKGVMRIPVTFLTPLPRLIGSGVTDNTITVYTVYKSEEYE